MLPLPQLAQTHDMKRNNRPAAADPTAVVLAPELAIQIDRAARLKRSVISFWAIGFRAYANVLRLGVLDRGRKRSFAISALDARVNLGPVDSGLIVKFKSRPKRNRSPCPRIADRCSGR